MECERRGSTWAGAVESALVNYVPADAIMRSGSRGANCPSGQIEASPAGVRATLL